MSGRVKNLLSYLLVALMLLGSLPALSVSADDGADEYYYSAYKDVLESYFSLASGLKKPESVPKYGDYYLFTYQGNIYEFGYTFLDYDNNGIKELIFSFPENTGLIYEMYTLVKGNVKKVLGSWNRCQYNLCGDGVIYMYGSGGAMTGSNGLYRYSGDKLTTIEEVYHDYYPNPEDPGMHFFITYSDTKTPFADKELTEKEWESKRTEYANMTKPISVTPLYEYDDIFFASNQYNEVNRRGFVYKVADNEVSITNYFGSSSEEIIPDTIDGYPVTSIGERAFNSCDLLNSVVIPDSVTSIGSYAFSNCPNLTSVTVPQYVLSSFYSYLDMNTIKNITISEGATSIPSFFFMGYSGLESIIIPDSVKEIGSYAFSLCESLKSFEIPDGVTKINYGLFFDCKNLESIVIPDSVTEIFELAFYGCSSLESVIIPESVTFIGDDAFHNISGLTIYGYEGSYAESYALKNEIPFVALKESSVILGDANEDGVVNVKDATAIQKHLADLLTLSDVGIKCADVDSSGGINIKDATAIQKHIADIETGFDIGSAIT